MQDAGLEAAPARDTHLRLRGRSGLLEGRPWQPAGESRVAFCCTWL